MEAKKSKGSDFIIEFGKKVVGEHFNLDDPRRRKIYEDLYYYFYLAKLSKPERKVSPLLEKTTLDPNKGILFTGDLGVGKTDCFRVLNRMFKSFRFCQAKKNIERDLKKYGEDDMFSTYGYELKSDLAIDEVGEEELEVWVFKNKVMPVGSLMLERYDLWKHEGYRTHMITNHSTDSLGTRYGERNFDRFFEMFNHIHWAGSSLRRS